MSGVALDHFSRCDSKSLPGIFAVRGRIDEAEPFRLELASPVEEKISPERFAEILRAVADKIDPKADRG